MSCLPARLGVAHPLLLQCRARSGSGTDDVRDTRYMTTDDQDPAMHPGEEQQEEDRHARGDMWGKPIIYDYTRMTGGSMIEEGASIAKRLDVRAISTIGNIPTATGVAEAGGSGVPIGAIVGGSVAGVVVLVTAALCIYFLWWRRRKPYARVGIPEDDEDVVHFPDTHPLVGSTSGADVHPPAVILPVSEMRPFIVPDSVSDTPMLIGSAERGSLGAPSASSQGDAGSTVTMTAGLVGPLQFAGEGGGVGAAAHMRVVDGPAEGHAGYELHSASHLRMRAQLRVRVLCHLREVSGHSLGGEFGCIWGKHLWEKAWWDRS
ncbi:hypothetical protein L226DRAFT_525211 [Lentinus tigrinus ALCF2SS1-7]|uniref:uncharacterized protein n=1 Tax=Lentinus tigrinus ALCF2SS1-7 TaxID=1328758 RepID=UPI001166045C|nr:hypothetical protein L226DRAFT_525211 [Lentinus tigrinus ALCF2SS1-7]